MFGLPADRPEPSVEIRRRTGFVSEDKDLYDVHDRRRDDPLHARRSFRAGAPISSSAICAPFDLPADRKVKALSRGMRTKLALLLALCRGADLLILDEPTSGLDPAITEEVLQAIVSHVAQRGDDACSSRRIRSPKSIRLPTTWRSSIAARSRLPARSTICARGIAAFSWYSIGEAPEPAFRAPGVVRIRREGRVLTRAVERRGRGDPRRGARAQPGVNRSRPRHAERDLPRNRDSGGLRCSGTSRGSTPGRVF